MKLSSYITLALAALAAETMASPSYALGAPYCPPRPVSQLQKKAILDEFLNKIYIEKNFTQALLDHMPEDYIQHNPSILSGRANAIEYFSASNPSAVNFTIVRVGVDGDLAFSHSHMDMAGVPRPSVLVDLFRFNGSCLQEHWDVIQAVPVNKTNPLPMW